LFRQNNIFGKPKIDQRQACAEKSRIGRGATIRKQSLTAGKIHHTTKQAFPTCPEALHNSGHNIETACTFAAPAIASIVALFVGTSLTVVVIPLVAGVAIACLRATSW